MDCSLLKALSLGILESLLAATFGKCVGRAGKGGLGRPLIADVLRPYSERTLIS